MTFGYKTVEDDVLNIRNLEFVIHLNHNLLSELSSLLKIKGYLKYFNSIYSFENIHTLQPLFTDTHSTAETI